MFYKIKIKDNEIVKSVLVGAIKKNPLECFVGEYSRYGKQIKRIAWRDGFCYDQSYIYNIAIIKHITDKIF